MTTDSGPQDPGARGSNQSGVRAYNERLVLTLIRQMGPLAKAEIARLTGLSAQTISVIIRALEGEALLVKGEPQRGRVGQPSVPMHLAADGAYALGLKVGRRSLEMVLVDFHGTILARRRQTHRYPVPAAVVAFTQDAMAELLAGLTARQAARVAGLGIAMPFRLWDWARPLGVEDADMAVWRDRDIVEEIGRDLDMPVYLRNDASSACNAELVFGDPDRPRDFVYFFIGFFIGGGIVLDNTLYTGRTGNAGALGSIPIGGGDGQLIDIASLVTLARQIEADGGASDTLWEAPEDWDVPDQALEGWMAEAASGLAQAIVAAACVIDFETVMIDGWMPEPVRDRLVAMTSECIAVLQMSGIERPSLRPGSIGSDARALGAASLPLSTRFLVDRFSFLKA